MKASLHLGTRVDYGFLSLTLVSLLAYSSRNFGHVTGFLATKNGAPQRRQGFSMKTKPFVIALSIVLGVVCLHTSLLAQSTFGTILGTVTDASDAVMPNIVVKVTNQGEGITREVRTDAQGTYRAENLKDGLYTVKVQAEGFREVTVQDIRLTARQMVRSDLKLVVGSTTEKVEVVANAELISTENQTISTSVTSTEVLNLPANYRGDGSTSPYGLLAYLPGVTGDKVGNISVQGSGINQVEYSLDGISTTDIRSSGPQREMFPSAESIAEMKVQGSGSGAEYGNPADITTTSKSGTNVFHGSAFEYLQNAALDAKQFSIFTVGKAAKSANTFGGSIGGPLFGKRTFFFGDYEGMRYRTSTLRTGTVPTQAMRNGDFSAFSVQLHDLDGTPFPGNIIPTDRFDSRVPLILQYYPLPNQGGVDNSAIPQLGRKHSQPHPFRSVRYSHRPHHQQQAECFRPLDVQEWQTRQPFCPDPSCGNRFRT